MDRPLIDWLYSSEEQESIRSLWKDEDERPNIRQAFGIRILGRSDVLLPQRFLDIAFMVCLSNNFTRNEEECLQVATFIFKGVRSELSSSILPRLTEDDGLNFSIKSLISLSFFLAAMIERHKRTGAPSPEYYRRASQCRFAASGYEEVANHHSQWEGFLSEAFIL